MDITASRRILNRTFRQSAMMKQLLRMRLLRTARRERRARRVSGSSVVSEFNDIIEFRSQKQADRFVKGKSLGFLPKRIPSPPDIPDEEFNSLQRSIEMKSLDDTLRDYMHVFQKRRNLPDEVHERLARDLNDENEWPDLADDYESSSEEDPSTLSETTNDEGDTGSESTSNGTDGDFTLIVDTDESSGSARQNSPPGQDHAPFRIHSRTRRSASYTPQKMSAGEDVSSRMNLVHAAIKSKPIVVLTKLPEEDLDDSLSTVFDPPSCSTSIAHSSADSDHSQMESDFDQTWKAGCDADQVASGEETPDENAEFNIALGESTIRADLSSSSCNDEYDISGSQQSQYEPKTPTNEGHRRDKRTPSTVQATRRRASPFSVNSSITSPQGGSTETPIRKRLRELGILPKLQLRRQSSTASWHSSADDSRNVSRVSTGSNSLIIKRFAAMDIATTPKKRSRNFFADPRQRNRTLQVFATPQRPMRTLEDALAPTTDLSHLVGIRTVSPHSCL